MFFNTFDGISAYINGAVLCNRKLKVSRTASVEGAKRVLSMGTDILIFPDGVQNKTPDKLLLDFWHGVYRLAKETGSKIVPVIHYLAEPHKKCKANVIHTVVAAPINMEGLFEKEGIQLLRDTMATWYYLMLEKYGRSTRDELLNGFSNADDAWENYVAMHTGCIKYYDLEIELKGDFRPHSIIRSEDVWRAVANINYITPLNAFHVAFANQMIEREKKRDFQRRF